MSGLDEREEQVLATIITEYIHNSEPVGSRNVSKIGPLQLSPATIRNIMGDLEEKGYLEQLHVSSGRVPTDLGYRYYIDHLAVYTPDPASVKDIEESLDFSPPNLRSLMKEFSKRLGALTKAVGFVAAPKTDTAEVKHIEFTRINKHTALAILITKSGIVQNILLPLQLSELALSDIAAFLNERLETISLAELDSILRQEVDSQTAVIREITAKLVDLERDMAVDNIFLDGTANILNFPEFQDAQKLKGLLAALEEKKSLAEIVERFIRTKGVQVFVGSEVGSSYLSDMGVVTSSFEVDGDVIGMLGVIGPKRMEYQKMVAVVNYSAQIITQLLQELYGE
ncbi:MAG: heat-inducible transcriptional repressor HrcA [Deferribacteraceae bacterium]|jgi:heat-inducible transcriptional repressor|nr:heat-inducible transcriptional repressor HrcA [Deferribacteraceae bacterium]